LNLIIVFDLFIFKVFHPLTYEGGAEITKIQDPISRKAIEIQVNEYGQTPKQLFKNPHPKRFSSKICEIFIDETNKIINFNLKEEGELNINQEQEVVDEVPQTQVSIDDGVSNLEIREVSYNFDRTYTQLAKFHKK
jgi:hypothetical protein